MESGSRGAGI